MKTKILVDAHIFDSSYQGIGTYIKGLYCALADDPNLQIVFCAQNIQVLKNYIDHPKIEYIQLKSGSKFKRLIFEIPQIIKKGKFDYAHFQYIVPPIKRCKYIITIHDLLFLSYPEYFPLKYRIVKKVLFYISAKRSDFIFTVSAFSKLEIINFFKINSNEIYITPNAVNYLDDIEIIDVKEKYHIKKFILSVSRFEPRKNQLLLVNEFINGKLFEKGYDLVLIGTKVAGFESDYYQKVVDAIPKNIINRIHFFENLSQKELYSFYIQSECFIYPSIAEGFGLPPLEAGILKTKVLTSNSTAMSDFDFFKYFYSPNDKQGLKDKLLEIIDDANYPYDAIASIIKEKYNWINTAKKFKEILNLNNDE